MSAVPHLEIIPQFSLQGLNTLALPGHAEFFCSVTDQVQVQQALDYARQNSLPVTALGGGSNMVLAGDIAGLVIHLESTGIYCEELDDDLVHVTFAAGENWHQAVIYCLDQGWYGLENLSLIPGNMGAAPIQNIGAYGVELCDLFVSLEAVEISTGRLVVINKADCEFGYRDSIFKQAYENQYLITQVTLALSRVPKVDIHYPALAAALADQRLDQMAKDALPTPEMVSAAVCSVRRSKLPDPAQIPNAGSFFKNPVVRLELLQKLLESNPGMPHFIQSLSNQTNSNQTNSNQPHSNQPHSNQTPPNREHSSQSLASAKIPAAWLIDQCGFRGLRSGNVAVHEHQALVLVNFGGTGTELLGLAAEIQAKVQARFSIALEIEPRVYGSATS